MYDICAYILNGMECDIKTEELEMKILALEAKEKYQQYFLFTLFLITAWNGCGIKPIRRLYLLYISVHLAIYVNQRSFQEEATSV